MKIQILFGDRRDLESQLSALEAQVNIMAMTVADLQAAQSKLLADLEAEKDIVTAIESAVTGLVDLNAAQKQQIADLLAQLGNGVSITAAQLQGLLDGMNAADAATLAMKARIAAAVVKGTPAA